jgi:flagellum-specific ATP synthase
MSLQEEYITRIERTRPYRWLGRVSKIIGLVVESNGPAASVGEMVEIRSLDGNRVVSAEVVGFRADRTLLMPLSEMSGISYGDEVVSRGRLFSVGVSESLLGRVVDGLGHPIDGRGPILAAQERLVHGHAPRPMERPCISEPLPIGVRAIDGLLTCGKGQRIGVFGGSGVGKSVLLGEIAKNTQASVNVIALVGERGREVRDFLQHNLQDALGHSVVVAATSDQPALVRMKGAFVATTIAEYFRDLGHDVLFIMDSVTRVATAMREVGLAIGEPPTTRGYTPSVFAMLPKLLERAGRNQKGSITGFYAVLVEGDDTNEPLSDQVRSILDGHIVLSRKLASRGFYPAIDIHESVSRTMPDIVTEEHLSAAQRFKAITYTYREAEDMINIGAYKKGSSAEIDHAIAFCPRANEYRRQAVNECSHDMQYDVQRLIELVQEPSPNLKGAI